MATKRNQPCPCGSGRRYKKCCSVPPEESFSVKPAQASALVSRGNVSLGQGDLDQALRFYREALSVEPEYALAYFNLAGVLRELGKIEEAVTNYEFFLSLQPQDDEAYINLGTLYNVLGRGEEAEKCCEKALLLNPSNPTAHCNWGESLMMQGMLEKAGESFSEALVHQPDYPKAQIFLAICAWINGDWDCCRQYLDSAFNHFSKTAKSDDKFIEPYAQLLDKLLKYRNANSSEYANGKNLPVLYVVGDSHSLSLANTKVNFRGVEYLAKAKIIIGCKAWHLSNKERNQYKWSFRNHLQSLPIGASVVINIGEIDCRLNEGIIRKHKNSGNDLSESVSSLVSNYIDYVLEMCLPRDIKPFVCNIPLQLMGDEKISAEDEKLQKTVVAKFNQSLVDNCGGRAIQILDVDALAKNDDGTPRDEYHLDDFHLYPFVFAQLLRAV